MLRTNWRNAWAWAVALGSCWSAARAAEPLDVEVKTDVEYGKVGDEALLLDLVSPPKGERPRPGIILIHGGGWAGGRKEDFTPFAQDVAASG